MKTYHVYRGDVLVDVVEAFTTPGAVIQAAARTDIPAAELHAQTTVRQTEAAQ